jgi:hypothetical protein
MRSAGLFLLLAGLAGAAAAGGLAAAGEALDVRVTSELSTGSLAEPSGVPIRQTTLRLRYRGEGWTAQAELPSLRVAGLPGGITRPRLAARSVDQGAGDARLKFAVPLRPAGPAATGLDLVLRIKSGTGHPVGGMDTGGAGQSLRLEWLRPAGPWALTGHVGWGRAGDLPGGNPGRHALHGEMGVARQLAGRVELGGFVDLRQRTRTDAMLREATLYAALDEGESRWMLHVGRSLVPSNPDAWAGVTFRRPF